MKKALTLILFMAGAVLTAVTFAEDSNPYDPDKALQLSQKAIGQSIGDYGQRSPT